MWENINAAFAKQLTECARMDRRIVVVDPEVARSTKMREFGQAHPDSFFEMGVAEQNSVGVSAGMASCGLIPFCVSFAPFATMRPFEMIRTSVGYTCQPVRIVGAYAAFTDGKDGATHEAMEDIAQLRTVPNLQIVTPSDANSARALVKASLKNDMPMYIRLENEDVPTIYADDFEFEIGKSSVLCEGEDVTIAAYGTAVHRALEAADILNKSGIRAEVLDTATLKPFDEGTLLKSLRKTGRLVTMEDHTLVGGLGAICAETIARAGMSVRISSLGIPDVFGLSGTPNQLREYFHITAQDAVCEALRMTRGEDHV